MPTNRTLIEDYFTRYAPQHIQLGHGALILLDGHFDAVDASNYNLTVPETPEAAKKLERLAIAAIGPVLHEGRPLIDVLLVSQDQQFENRWEREDIFGEESLIADADLVLGLKALAKLDTCLREALGRPLFTTLVTLNCEPEASILHRSIMSVVRAMFAYAAAGEVDKVKRLAPLATLMRHTVPVCEFDVGGWLFRTGDPRKASMTEGVEIDLNAQDTAATTPAS